MERISKPEKPFSPENYEERLLALTFAAGALARTNDELKAENEALKAKNRERDEETERLKQEALMDRPIPILFNKRAIEAEVKNRIERREPCLVFWIDLDKFKAFNDKIGHTEADKVLLKWAILLLDEKFTRGDDGLGVVDQADDLDVMRGRVGGDEFLVVSGLTNLGGERTDDPHQQRLNMEERIRSIEGKLHDAVPMTKEVGVGLSVGSAYFDPNNPVSAEELMAQADKAMYKEKKRKSAER